MTRIPVATRSQRVPRLLRRCRSLPKHLARRFDTVIMHCDNTVREPLPENGRRMLAVLDADPAGIAIAQRAMRAAGEPYGVVERRLRDGDHFYALDDGSGPIAFNWVCFRRRREIGLWIEAAPGRTILYNGFVLPEHRGQGVGKEMIRRLCSVLAEQGSTELVSAISTRNKASIGMMAANGFRPVLETRRWMIADHYFTPMRIAVLNPAGEALLGHHVAARQ